MTDLDKMLERVKRADKLTYSFFEEIVRAFGIPSVNDTFAMGAAAYAGAWESAAVALCERLFPDWQHGYEKLRPANGGAQAWLAPNMTCERSRGATPALALCAAILRARIAQGEM